MRSALGIQFDTFDDRLGNDSQLVVRLSDGYGVREVAEIITMLANRRWRRHLKTEIETLLIAGVARANAKLIPRVGRGLFVGVAGAISDPKQHTTHERFIFAIIQIQILLQRIRSSSLHQSETDRGFGLVVANCREMYQTRPVSSVGNRIPIGCAKNGLKQFLE